MSQNAQNKNPSAEQLKSRIQRLEGAYEDQYWFVSRSKAMTQANEALSRLRRDSMSGSADEASVLIWGEPGAGCSGFARMVHKGSRRANAAWLRINCGEMKSQELRAEIFGTSNKPGLMELAEGGTLYLDQVQCLPMELQNDLAQAVTSRAFRRVGGHDNLSLDVRFVCSSWADLEKKVDQGQFSESLFKALCRIRIEIPALKNRVEDVIPMAQGFAEAACKRAGKSFSGFTQDSKNALEDYSWPGNEEELHSVMQRAAILSSGHGAMSVQAVLTPKQGAKIETGSSNAGLHTNSNEAIDPSVGYMETKRRWSEQFERDYLVGALSRHEGNVSAAAREAKIDRSNFLRLLRRYGIKSSEFRSKDEAQQSDQRQAA